MPNREERRRAQRAERKSRKQPEQYVTGVAEISVDSDGNMNGTFWDGNGRRVDNALGSDDVSRMASEFVQRDITFGAEDG